MVDCTVKLKWQSNYTRSCMTPHSVESWSAGLLMHPGSLPASYSPRWARHIIFFLFFASFSFSSSHISSNFPEFLPHSVFRLVLSGPGYTTECTNPLCEYPSISAITMFCPYPNPPIPAIIFAPPPYHPHIPAIIFGLPSWRHVPVGSFVLSTPPRWNSNVTQWKPVTFMTLPSHSPLPSLLLSHYKNPPIPAMRMMFCHSILLLFLCYTSWEPITANGNRNNG